MKEKIISIGLAPWLLLVLFALVLHTPAQGADIRSSDDCYRLIELKTDSLPSLNIARSGHETLCLNGELTVLGGHTDGFSPTATAEYFSDGAWHTVSLTYPHDHGTVIELRSGKVFLAGGHKEPLGIGQLYSAELYDPATHTSQGFGCMEHKRAYANAIEMADGQIVISGNWFWDDGIEIFEDVYNSGICNAAIHKESTIARANPYILRISDDDAIIFGLVDTKGGKTYSSSVDRLNAPAYHEPFLDNWHPIHTINTRHSTNNFIGDESSGQYKWLLPVENYEKGEVAIAQVSGTSNDTVARFSLLATSCSIPDSILGRKIIYTSLICDRDRGIAYLIGDNDEAQIIVIAIPYNTPSYSPLNIYITEPQPFLARNGSPVLTPEGDLVFAGGHLVNNFFPSGKVIRLALGQPEGKSSVTTLMSNARSLRWLCVFISIIIICALAALLCYRHKKKKAHAPAVVEPALPEDGDSFTQEENLTKEEILAELYRRIERQMVEGQLFLNPNLRATDVAAAVGTNTTYVSAAINSQCECSFSQYVTNYRIKHAQELMRMNPDSKISNISALSGFSSDSTFFRVFRSSTGMTPKEWLAAIKDRKQTK